MPINKLGIHTQPSTVDWLRGGGIGELRWSNAQGQDGRHCIDIIAVEVLPNPNGFILI